MAKCHPELSSFFRRKCVFLKRPWVNYERRSICQDTGELACDTKGGNFEQDRVHLSERRSVKTNWLISLQVEVHFSFYQDSNKIRSQNNGDRLVVYDGNKEKCFAEQERQHLDELIFVEGFA